MQAALRAELERLKTRGRHRRGAGPVQDPRQGATCIRSLRQQPGAGQRSSPTTRRLYGDWRELFRSVDRLDKVTAADIRRVAVATFRPDEPDGGDRRDGGAGGRTGEPAAAPEEAPSDERALRTPPPQRRRPSPRRSPPSCSPSASRSAPPRRRRRRSASVDQLRYPPLPAFDIPQPRRVVLANGMVVMLVEDHELPLVDGVALIRTGARLEPADKVGLAELTGEVLRSGGTATMSGDELDDYLEGKAASDRDLDRRRPRPGLALLLSRATSPPCSSVFADVLRRPAFDAGRLEVARTRRSPPSPARTTSRTRSSFRELAKLVYGADSPYARTPTYATVGGITRDDLVAWHAPLLPPRAHRCSGLVGDFRRRPRAGAHPRRLRRLAARSGGGRPRAGLPDERRSRGSGSSRRTT